MQSALEGIRAWLEEQDVKVTQHPPEAQKTRARLTITLDEDEPPLQVEVEEVVEREDEGSTLRLLHFVSIFPVTASSAGAVELMRFLMLLNATVAFPGFVLDERNGKVLFRHVAVVPESGIDMQVVERVLSAVSVLQDTFAEPLVALAEGRSTVSDVLAAANAEA